MLLEDIIIIYIYITNIEEGTKLCKEINIDKYSCIENISSEILRDALLAIPGRITGIFNLSFELSEIPISWKTTKVYTRFYLKQVMHVNFEVSNLRPISLLPLPSKLTEKIVHNRVYNHCNNNDLLDKRQGGFRPNYSTISTTAFYINDLYEAMNRNEITLSVYRDAMKAFDTVNHEIVINKLEYFGITG